MAGAAAQPVGRAAPRQRARPEVLPLLAGPLQAGAELVEGVPGGAAAQPVGPDIRPF